MLKTNIIGFMILGFSLTGFSSVNNNRKVNKIRKDLVEFSKACSVIPHAKILVESTEDNLTNKSLVEKVKKRLSNSHNIFFWL